MEVDLEKQTARALAPSWELETEGTDFDREVILSLLSDRILEWLENDFERLVNAMYRLDVPEVRFHAAMSLRDPKLIAPEIAKLVWERELQRAWFRYKYS